MTFVFYCGPWATSFAAAWPIFDPPLCLLLYISTCVGDGRGREQFGLDVRRGDGVERG